MKTQQDINIDSLVKVTLGQHAGKHCKVVGIGFSGHSAHDTLALVAQWTPMSPDPIFVFRFQCEPVICPGALPPVVRRPDPAPATERVCRFREGDEVRVTQPALTRHGQTGRIIEVHLDPVAPDAFRGGMPVLNARYTVRFVMKPTNPYGCEFSEKVTLWDNELTRA